MNLLRAAFCLALLTAAAQVPVRAQEKIDAAAEGARLKGKDPGARLQALDRLRRARTPEARSAILSALRAEKRGSTRAGLVSALAENPSPEVSVESVRLLRDKADPPSRLAAARTLGYARGAEGFSALRAVALDPGESSMLRVRALSSLSRYSGPEAVEVFSQALKDGDPFIRRQALLIFSAAYPQEVALPRVRAAVDDEDASVRESAQRTLKEWKTE